MTNTYAQAPWLNFERKKITDWTPLLYTQELYTQEKQTKNQFFFGNTDVNMISDILDLSVLATTLQGHHRK